MNARRKEEIIDDKDVENEESPHEKNVLPDCSCSLDVDREIAKWQPCLPVLLFQGQWTGWTAFGI
jgi:hypothetical protein